MTTTWRTGEQVCPWGHPERRGTLSAGASCVHQGGFRGWSSLAAHAQWFVQHNCLRTPQPAHHPLLSSAACRVCCRDIKLDNTLLDGSIPATVKLCDFQVGPWGHQGHGRCPPALFGKRMCACASQLARPFDQPNRGAPFNHPRPLLCLFCAAVQQVLGPAAADAHEDAPGHRGE